MAEYKYSAYLSVDTSAEFDKTHSPGTPAPFSGVYRCMGCGREVASNVGQPLPPQNHHQHSTAQGAITWRLVVWADHKPKP
jgi:hypothetical protein